MMKMEIKELLRHVYPSCKVIIYDGGCEYDTIAGKYYDMVDEDVYCDDFAFYKDHLAIFIA